MIPKYKPASHLSDNESEKSYNSEEERKNYERLHTYREKRKYNLISNKEQVFSYLLKEDKKAHSYGFNIRKDVYGKLKTKDIAYKYAIGEWEFSDIITYDPSIILTKNVKKWNDMITDNWFYLKNLGIKFY